MAITTIKIPPLSLICTKEILELLKDRGKSLRNRIMFLFKEF